MEDEVLQDDHDSVCKTSTIMINYKSSIDQLSL